eukprot:m.55484 g.55484  ORF g.55484 m.55484 type:complete len:116 (-) comp16888_c0_seq1:189-536(-)
MNWSAERNAAMGSVPNVPANIPIMPSRIVAFVWDCTPCKSPRDTTTNLAHFMIAEPWGTARDVFVSNCFQSGATAKFGKCADESEIAVDDNNKHSTKTDSLDSGTSPGSAAEVLE